MGKTILSNTIAKIGTPVNEENDKRRSKAFDDIAGCLERCYREFEKFNRMKRSDDIKHTTEAFENEEKMVNLINSLKEEINGEILRIACFGTLIEKGGLDDVIRREIDRTIQRLSHSKEEDTFDLAKENVINDFEEMDKTMTTKKLDHIKGYPLTESEIKGKRKIVPLISKQEDHRGLAQWQVDIMQGRDNGFFADAFPSRDSGIIVDIDVARHRRRNRQGREINEER